jgi:hypothetical protein
MSWIRPANRPTRRGHDPIELCGDTPEWIWDDLALLREELAVEAFGAAWAHVGPIRGLPFRFLHELDAWGDGPGASSSAA